MRAARWKLVFTVVLLGLAVLVYGLHAFSLYVDHEDACHVIALDVAERIRDGQVLDSASLNNLIGQLITGSVIHGRVSRYGVATDLNGNAFAINWDADTVIVRTQRCVWQPIAISRIVSVR